MQGYEGVCGTQIHKAMSVCVRNTDTQGYLHAASMQLWETS